MHVFCISMRGRESANRIGNAFHPNPFLDQDFRMRTICLVSCTSKKGDYPAAAERLYRSALFDGASRYARQRADLWFVLSAKFGLLHPGDRIPPYDESLNSMSRTDRSIWAKKVYVQLRSVLNAGDRVIFLAGKPYREYLEGYLSRDGFENVAPMSSLGIGSQVGWLQRLDKEHQRVADLDKLYKLLDRLRVGFGGERLMNLSSSKSNWPVKGLYFFFEPGERRMLNPFEARVVRVGTHAVSEGSRSTLWNRLRTHRGGKNGLGNHRGSIFRLHVGDALIRSCSLDQIFPTWGVGQSAAATIRADEEELELEVSDTIGKMSVLWVDIDDAAGPHSDRAYLERNVIALLSGFTGPMDLASPTWLGNSSAKEPIRRSSLWNINYIDLQYDLRALEVFERYVDITLGVMPRTTMSLAPVNWFNRQTDSTTSLRQLSLLGR